MSGPPLLGRVLWGVRTGAAVAAGIGFWSLPFDLADRSSAAELAERGRLEKVDAVQVNVGLTGPGRRADTAVIAVDVRLPGVADGNWVGLQGVHGPVIDIFAEGAPGEGWQSPSAETGYLAPLPVRYATGGRGSVDAMAQADIDYWVASDDPEIDLIMGGTGLGVLAATFAPMAAATLRSRKAGSGEPRGP